MQIRQILAFDAVSDSKNQTGIIGNATSSVDRPKEEQALPDLQIKDHVYVRPENQKDTVADKVEQDLSGATDTISIKNKLAVFGATASDEDLSEMEKRGYSMLESDPNTLVTVADQIKMQLAKAGVDVSVMGGLSDEEIGAMTGNAIQAIAVGQALQQADLPVTPQIVEEGAAALVAGEEIAAGGSELSADSVTYLLTNELEPTVENIYRSIYGVSPQGEGMPQELTEEMAAAMEDMEEQIASVISEAGLPVTEETMTDGKWMISKEIPLTPELLAYYEELKEFDPDISRDDLLGAVTGAVAQGKSPMEANLIPGNALTAHRQMEETRLMMTLRANLALMKQGVSIDTQELQAVVEELKQQEQAYLAEVLGGATAEETQVRVDLYEETMETMDQLAQKPASVLGEYADIAQITPRELQGRSEDYQQAAARYETLMTAPRRDMGDSIQKAFQNVDAILEDLQIPVNEQNQRAVRILAYNNMELTPENITRIKGADEQVQRMFSNMKPAVVLEMIREGINPLDLSIEELNQKTEQIADRQGSTSTEEGYAKFLYQLEQQHGISQEERESFIGLYRLMHQVEAGDGAAIGALIQQGTDVTMRNLMMAVRSSKHANMDYRIDDSFGAIEEFRVEDLSITQQVEMAYQTACLKDAKEAVTPGKLAQFPDENAYMQLTPEELARQLQDMEDSRGQKEYIEAQRQEIQRAVESPDEVYEMLRRFDIPASPLNINAMQQLLQHPNKLFADLQSGGKAEKKDEDEAFAVDWDSLMGDLIEDFGEAVKKPEEMAKAQHKLEELAENAMKNVLVSKDVSSIDVRGMKLVMTQISTIGRMAKQEETYHIPIMVADEVGNMSLKIVRGTEEKGLVDIAFKTEISGTVRASFRYEKEGITGEIDCDRRDTQETFSRNMGILADRMQKAADVGVTFTFGWKENLSTADIYGQEESDFVTTREREPVLTSKLYGMAKAFVDAMGDIL